VHAFGSKGPTDRFSHRLGTNGRWSVATAAATPQAVGGHALQTVQKKTTAAIDPGSEASSAQSTGTTLHALHQEKLLRSTASESKPQLSTCEVRNAQHSQPAEPSTPLCCQWSAVAPCGNPLPLHSSSQELSGTDDAYTNPDKTCRQQLIRAGGRRSTRPCCKLLPELILLCPSNSMQRKRKEAKLGGPQLSWLLAPVNINPKKCSPAHMISQCMFSIGQQLL